MIRKLKGVGVVLVAVIAMTSVVASSARAATYTSVNGNYPTTVTGNQNGIHEFKAGIRTFTCQKAHFEGTAGAASSELTITPTYSNCAASGGLPVTVTLGTAGHKCDYLFHATSETAATTDIVCSAGESIDVDVYGSRPAHEEGKAPVCEITIAGQTGLAGLSMRSEGSGTGATIQTEGTVVLAVSIKGSPLVCGTGTTATYSGKTPLVATFVGGAEGIHVK